MEFILYKTKIKISPLFFAVLTAFLLTDKTGIAAPVLIFSFLHEAGHFLALLFQKSFPQRLELTPFGIRMQLNENLSTAKKCAVLIFGFGVNFFLALIFFVLKNEICMYINIFIGIFTAMPLASTDGGGVLFIVLEKLFPEKYETISKFVFILFAAIMIILIIFVILLTKNIFLFIPVIYILIMALKKSPFI